MKRIILPEIAELNAERAINLVTAEYRVTREALLSNNGYGDRRTRLARAFAMTLCWRGGMTQLRIANLFGKHPGRVHRTIARIERTCAMNPDFIERIEPVLRDLYFRSGTARARAEQHDFAG